MAGNPKKKARQRRRARNPATEAALPLNFHSELELSRIESGGRLTSIDEEWADGRDIVPVRNVEHIDGQFQIGALAHGHTLRNTKIVEHGPGRNSRVAAEIAVELEQCRESLR